MADLSWQAAERRMLDLAVALWTGLLKFDHTASVAGKKLVQDQNAGFQVSLAVVVKDCLRAKAASTSLIRGRAMKRFHTWAIKAVAGYDGGVTGSLAYRYIQHLEAEGAAPSSGQSFLSSLAFAGGVFGLDNALEAVKSSRWKAFPSVMALESE
eukprot:1840382-Amphidinium_carterae.1